MSTPNAQNGWRTSPLYTIPEAARLAQVSTTTVRRWLYGYQSPDYQMAPVFGEQNRVGQAEALVSFLQLVEIVIASKFRRRHVTLERVRRAYEFSKTEWKLEHPFASLRLESFGGHILRRFEEQEPGASLLVLDQPGQWTLPSIVVEVLHDFDYELDFAARWFPVGKNVPIVVDPRFSAGVPTIPERRVTVATVQRRFQAGQPIRFIADDLKVKPTIVEEILRYAERVAA